MSRLNFLVVLSFILVGCVSPTPRTILNINIFDQLQGTWGPEFRTERTTVLSHWLHQHSPDLVVMQEARGVLPGAEGGGADSVDGILLRDLYPYRRYVHEMTGADGASYGYWMGAKAQPVKEWKDGFAFPGGVARMTEAALWKSTAKCVGVLSLHLSYQNTTVRQLEAQWILDWLSAHKVDCENWLVMGDFNADAESKEIQILMNGGLVSLVKNKKPTVGAFNPIRQIYGKDIPSQTIDWIFATAEVTGAARVVFDQPVEGQWISDHAGVWGKIR